MANEFGSQYALYQITITKMSGSDDSKTYWTYRRYSDFHDIDIRLREVLGETDFPLELPKKEWFISQESRDYTYCLTEVKVGNLSTRVSRSRGSVSK